MANYAIVAAPSTQPVSGTVTAIPIQTTRTDSFTATGNGVTVPVQGIKNFAIQVVGVGGTATMWTVILEGSLDGVTFSPILTHTQALGDGVNLWNTTPSPVNYIRSRCSVLTLSPATSINSNILGLA